MTKRYFYTDALAAAWMAREHGLRFDADWSEGKLESADWKFLAHMIETRNLLLIEDIKYYVSEDSLAILEPQVGDVVRLKQNAEDINLNRAMYPYREIVTIEFRDSLRADDECKIIQRNGKAFFTPEVEE